MTTMQLVILCGCIFLAGDNRGFNNMERGIVLLLGAAIWGVLRHYEYFGYYG